MVLALDRARPRRFPTPRLPLTAGSAYMRAHLHVPDRCPPRDAPDGLLAGLDLDLQRIPRMLALLVLAVPAGIFVSWVAVVFVVFSVLMLVSVSIYVTWGHQNEYRAERDLIRRELVDGDRPRDAL